MSAALGFWYCPQCGSNLKAERHKQWCGVPLGYETEDASGVIRDIGIDVGGRGYVEVNNGTVRYGSHSLESLARLIVGSAMSSDDGHEYAVSRDLIDALENLVAPQDVKPAMRFDSHKLGYTRRGDSLHVHYPHRDENGETRYGAGFAFDPHPEILAKPDSERGRLWKEMLTEPAFSDTPKSKTESSASVEVAE